MKLLLDPRQSGLSGDMLISTLTDFFNCQDYTNSLLEKICKTANELFSIVCSYKVEKTVVHHFEGTKLVFTVKKDFPHISVADFITQWKTLLTKLDLSESINQKIFVVLDRVIHVEQSVHGDTHKSLAEMHFHELNSIDTIVDITVTLAILDHNSFPTIFGLPTAIGTGTVTFSHGTFQQPAPAVAKMLELSSYPIVSRDIDFETTTPTGLALLTTVIESTNVLMNLPSGKILKTGIGLGQKQPDNLINYMKMWSMEEITENTTNNSDSSFENDGMIIIETHVDDASGELLGNIIETYSTMHGIKDASIYPLIMKKNRPGNCIRLLVDPQMVDLDTISLRLMKDTGSLGVRHYPVSRHKSVREITEQKITFANENYTIRVKISKIGNEIIAIKPEYEDIKGIAIKTNKSFKEIQDAVLRQIGINS